MDARLAIGSSGDIDIEANGSISGAGGVSAQTAGTGSVDVTTVGPVTATSEYGIIAAALFGGDVTVNAGDVSSVQATGIDVYAQDGGDIDITTGNVSGTTGILSNNNGDGDTVIRTNGTVTGTVDEGIFVEAESSVRLEVADTVTGARSGADIRGGQGGSGDISVTGAGGFVGLSNDGLRVRNSGSGRTDVDISGAVVATGGDGVIVRNSSADGGDVDVTTGDVTALSSGYNGITASSLSLDADVSVTANGDVAVDGFGVAAFLVDALATGNVEVTTNGSVTGDFGILAQTAGSGSVSVNASGAITVDEVGIQAVTQGGDITVAAGDVSAAGDYGIFAQQQNAAGAGNIDITTTGGISGDLSGIFAINDGSGAVSVNAAGPVTGREDIGILAVTMGGDVTVVAGDVSGDFYGVRAQQGNQAATGDIDIATTGAVSGEVGIGAFNTGSGVVSINASGPITATGIGILAQTSGGDITVEAGTVASTGEFGIFAQQADAGEAGEIDIATAGPISSGTHGIRALNAGSGATRIATAGTVTGAAGTGIEARGAAIEVTVGGMVTGDDYGLLVNGGIGGTGDISVTGAGGFAAANEDAVFILNAGSGSVTYNVSGPVSSTTGSGVVVADTAAGGDISVTTGSVTAMTAGRSAIFVDSVSTTADVTIVANGALGAGGDAVRAVLRDGATGNVAVTTRAAVTGENGIVAVNLGTGSTTVTADGLITATGTGVFATAVEGNVTVVAGDVTADGPVGIQAMVEPGGTGDLSVTAGNVSGGIGILATNDGTGAVSVTANGAVTGTAGDGIAARGRNAVTLTVADIVTGETNGLNLAGGLDGDGDILVTGAGGFTGQTGAAAFIQNLGAGTVTFDVSGPMLAVEGDGLIVADTVLGGDINVVTGDVTALRDGATAIQVSSASTTAGLDVTVNGDVQAGGRGLLAVLTDASATGDISVLTQGAVTGRQGIFALTEGSGAVTIASTGPITTTQTGILARSNGGNVAVAAGDVSGESAIFARQQNVAGAGNVAVVTTGAITGEVGIYAQNDGSGAVSVNASGPITTDDLGIAARSQGGDITIAAASVSGDATYGIHAFQQNAAGAGDIDITATGAVSGGIHGMLASNAGSGEIRITSTGSVSSAANGFFGIAALNSDASGDVVIDANNVSGADAGIRVENNGVGVTDLTVRGLVHGGTVGVSVFSDDNQDVQIANEGVIRNASGLSSDGAIEASGGFIDFTNTGTLTGDVNFQGGSSLFDNRGVWNAAGGQSAFGGVDDELVNAATGSILAGAAAGTAELSAFSGLETFHNAGTLTMVDGGTGDQLVTAADTVFAAGSLLQVDIAGLNLADLFATTGTLTLEAGARLDVSFNQPLTLGGRYVVARADGGLTGTFDFEDRLVTAFVGLRDGYTTTTAYVEIAQLRALIEAGETPNQRETARGTDSLPGANPLRTALLLLPDDAAARDAFDQLSGEIHPAVRRAMADDSRLFRDAVLDRLSDEQADGTVWGRALVNERNTDGDGNAAKAEHDVRGLIFGVDRAVTDSLTVGVAGGWFRTDLDILRRNSTATTESREVHAYLGGRMDHWRFRAGAGYAMTSTGTRRQIAFQGFSALPRAAYDGSVLQVFAETGYRVPLEGFYVEPFANLTAITAHTDAFYEVEGPAALAVLGRSESLTATTLGFRFQTEGTGDLSLRGTAGWRHLTGDLEPTGRHAFDGGPTFTVLGAVQSDIAAVGALEAQWRLSPNVTLGAAWDGIFGTEGQDHTITGRLRIAF
ncbi:MAG: autotransporter domain-containing protein [Brevundimonas sp.]|nr:autotransporter domain-containing protein [Brevundimonas sp.]